jgi:hypothetical protein
MAQRHGQLTQACLDLLTLWRHEVYPVPNRGVPRRNKRTGETVWGRGKVKAGVADICGCSIHGRHIAVEVKITPDKLKPAQLRFKQAVEQRGGLFILVENTTEALLEARKRGEV